MTGDFGAPPEVFPEAEAALGVGERDLCLRTTSGACPSFLKLGFQSLLPRCPSLGRIGGRLSGLESSFRSVVFSFLDLSTCRLLLSSRESEGDLRRLRRSDRSGLGVSALRGETPFRESPGETSLDGRLLLAALSGWGSGRWPLGTSFGFSAPGDTPLTSFLIGGGGSAGSSRDPSCTVSPPIREANCSPRSSNSDLANRRSANRRIS